MIIWILTNEKRVTFFNRRNALQMSPHNVALFLLALRGALGFHASQSTSSDWRLGYEKSSPTTASLTDVAALESAFGAAAVSGASSERLSSIAGLLQDLLQSPDLAPAPELQARIAVGLEDVASLLEDVAPAPSMVSTAPKGENVKSEGQSYAPWADWRSSKSSSSSSVFGASFVAAPARASVDTALKVTSLAASSPMRRRVGQGWRPWPASPP